MLKKIVDALNTTVEDLINGDADHKARATLKDAEVLRNFRDIEQLPEPEKNALLKVVAAFIRDWKAKQAYA